MKILFITHDTSRTGAPILLLRLMRVLKNAGYDIVSVIINDNGPLKPEFERLGPTMVYYAPWRKAFRLALRRKLFNRYGLGFNELFDGTDLVLSNTIANGHFIRIVRKFFKVPVVTYVHELEMMTTYLGNAIHETIEASDFLITPSDAVSNFLSSNYLLPETKIKRLNYFIPVEKNPVIAKKEAKKLVVGGCGTPDFRKGIDLFVQIAIATSERFKSSNIKFVWKGVSKEAVADVMTKFNLGKVGVAKSMTFLENSPDMEEFYRSIDVFLLTSREDPYPLVVLEAASHNVPTVCFEKSGGAIEFVGQEAGTVVELESIDQAVEAIYGYSENRELLAVHGNVAAIRWSSLHNNQSLILNQFEAITKNVFS